jgi:hypothetical protein
VQRPVPGVFGWYADTAGVVRMGIAHGDDGRSTRVYHRSEPGAPLKVIARARNREERVMIPAIFPAEPARRWSSTMTTRDTARCTTST